MTREPTVDLGSALLPQIAGTGDDYWAWVHRSVKPKGSLRIFPSDLLELLSHVPWWLVPIVWVPAVAVLAVLAVGPLGVPAFRVLLLALVGVALWTLLEYVLHRFVFHYRPRSAFGRRLHFLAHGIHHLDPWDRTRLVFPPLAALPIAGSVFLALHGATLLLAPAEATGTAVALMVGVLVGYVVYDMTHYYTHHARPKGRWGKFLKAYHLAHHHKWPERMYGVSQPLWDLVFRTGRPS